MNQRKTDKQTILVVDDTPENIDVLVGILKAYYKIKVALNGERALKIATGKNPPDLILLDIMMPGMGGYEVCRELKSRADTRKIPVIFVTVKSEVADESMGFKVGGVDYITKPVSQPIVLARVQTHLDLVNEKGKVEKLLSKTLLGSIKMMSDLLSISNPALFNQSSRIKSYVFKIARKLNFQDLWRIEIAAILSQMGKIAVPESVINKVRENKALTRKEQILFDAHYDTARDLLVNIPSLEIVGQIVAKQASRPPKSAIENWDYITLGGQILKVALGYDELIMSGRSNDEAVSMMLSEKEKYSSEILKILSEIEESTRDNVSKWINVKALKEGMILLEDMICDSETILLGKHMIISESILHLVQKNAEIRSIKEPIKVLVPK